MRSSTVNSLLEEHRLFIEHKCLGNLQAPITSVDTHIRQKMTYTGKITTCGKSHVPNVSALQTAQVACPPPRVPSRAVAVPDQVLCAKKAKRKKKTATRTHRSCCLV